MTTSRRPRRTQNRTAEKLTPKPSATPRVGETARMRRERRSQNSGTLPLGSLRKKATAHPKTVKPATRTRTTRSRTMGTPFTRTTGSPPPVYVRGGMANLPVQPRKLGAPPKRRYNVALNVPGAELHLPALPALRLSWRAFSGVFAALLLALAIYLWTSPQYRIDMVQVNGLQRLTGNDINTVVGLSGQQIFSANPQEIHNDIQQAFPDLMNISVKISLPAKVVVKAEERTPVIAWHQGGSEKWIDTDGMGFTPRGDATDLIVVEAKDSPPSIEKTSSMDIRFLPPEMVGAISRMAQKAPKGTPLLFDSQHGLGWKDPFGCQVYFGMDMRDMDEKLLVYQALVTKLQKDGIQPALISMEFLHAPYYRLEP